MLRPSSVVAGFRCTRYQSKAQIPTSACKRQGSPLPNKHRGVGAVMGACTGRIVASMHSSFEEVSACCAGFQPTATPCTSGSS